MTPKSPSPEFPRTHVSITLTLCKTKAVTLPARIPAMFIRTISAALIGYALLLVPIASTAADRGPSTPEERKQALEYIAHFEADPLNPALQPEKQWLTEWIIEVPDIHVNVCMIL